MSEAYPLVSIGIPTYNRAALIGRAVDSALQQSHPNVEILISDNASTDGTVAVCEALAARHERVQVQRQPQNLGATANFNAVLSMAHGQYFMWLGDDDWIDREYVSRTLAQLRSDPQVAMVSGTPVYYANGVRQGIGQIFCIDQRSALQRMLSYYWRVSDNGVFYGLMRRQDATAGRLVNTMGGDWLFVANLALRGKILMLDGTCVNRELGGATSSYEAIARAQGLPALQARYPFLAIAVAAAFHLVRRQGTGQRVFASRWLLGGAAFICILVKATRLRLSRFLQGSGNAAQSNC